MQKLGHVPYFRPTRPKNIKHLLEELASRELESTQLKINQVISRQKTSHREPPPSREPNIASSKLIRRHCLRRESSLSSNLQRPNSRGGKENIVKVAPQTTAALGFDDILRNDKPSRRGTPSTERYSAKQPALKGKDSVELPLIMANMVKKGSAEQRSRAEAAKRKTVVEFGEANNLQIIEEEDGVTPPTRLHTVGISFSKMQKQHSWVPFTVDFQ